MADLTLLKRQRGSTRTFITKAVDKADKELKEATINMLALKKLKSQLEIKRTDLKELDNKILELLTDGDELDADMVQAEEYFESVTDCLTAIDDKLNPTTISRSTSLSSVSSNNLTMKLPKIDPMKFDGKATDWNEFWGHFSASVDKNTNLDDSTKLVYLKGMLTGEAGNVVKRLAVTDLNYVSAKTLLTERFGNVYAIREAHLAALRCATPIKYLNDVAGLKRIYDDSESHVRGLRGAEMSEVSLNESVSPMILATMPRQWVTRYTGERKGVHVFPITELLDSIREEIFTQEKPDLFASYLVSTQPARRAPEEKTNKFNFDSKKTTNEKRQFTPKSTTSALTARIDSCLFCSKNDHKKEACPLSIADRKSACKSHGRCFRCLETRHVARECPARSTCDKCHRRHHTLVCDTDLATIELSKNTPPPTLNPTPITTLTPANMVETVHLQNAVMPVFTVKVAHRGRERIINCLLDTGSPSSYIVTSLALELELESRGQSVVQITKFDDEPKISVRHKYNVTILNCDDASKKCELHALETEKITHPVSLELTASLRASLKQRGIEFNEPSINVEILLLLGADFYGEILTGQSMKLEKRLCALETIFGWIPLGSSPNITSVATAFAPALQVSTSEHQNISTDDYLRNFWELESIGIRHETLNDDGDENDTRLQAFRDTTTTREGRYEVALPWVIDKQQLANNYRIAERRFWNLIRRLQRNPGLRIAYQKIFDDQLREGVIEECSNPDNPNCYYMPHRPVVKENRTTTKVRIVFDASSNAKKELSLNDCLDKGPNLLPEIVRMLIFFRWNFFALLSDIEKAFLQILLAQPDCDYVRFLWVQPDWNGTDPVIIRKMRQLRVVFGATSSPYLLNGTIIIHLDRSSDEFPITALRLKERFYVDDLIDSLKTLAEALKIFTESRVIMSRAHLMLHKWQSNSPELRELFRKEYPADATTEPEKEETSVLGLHWNFVEDILRVEIGDWADIPPTSKTTKREVTQTIARIFDPLGFLAPFTITGKFFLQELWKLGIDWDVILPDNLINDWRKWQTQISSLRHFSIPRHLGDTDETPIRRDFHFFCDASKKAYGVVVYLRTVYQDRVVTRLCLVKTRVAPIKTLTLPKLELMGALLLSRIAKKLNFLTTDSATYWTDSSITYFWIRNHQRKSHPFVTNRVREIIENTNTDDWRHVPGKDNPADRLTRGVPAKTLIEDEEWINGPSWLTKEPEEWPNNISAEEISEFDDLEEITSSTSINLIPIFLIETLLEPDRFSSWTKAIRVTAYLMRFLHNCRSKTEDQEKYKGNLNAQEMRNAEKRLILNMQSCRFVAEKICLKENRRVPPDSMLKKVNVICDTDGILRINSRIRTAKNEEDFNFPIVIDPNSNFSKLIIHGCHLRTLHGGLGDTLSEFRSRFWMPKARREIKSILRHCVTCRKVLQPTMTQMEAPLPNDRVEPSDPFEVTGVDFAGPLILKDGSKSYVALFTCAVTRGVHLELVSNLTSETFIDAFTRFTGRRGLPRIIMSDNAKTFKRAEKDLKLLYDSIIQTPFQNHLTTNNIDWRYIVELAPWWGGFWERLVKTVKLSLKKILGKSSLNFEQLLSTLVRIEANINSRPLTYVSDDPSEKPPLTPAHFLLTRRMIALPDHRQQRLELENTSRKELVGRWKHRQHLVQLFWRRWKHEYLVELREFRKTKKPSRELMEGDMVLVEELCTPRMQWKMARVRKVFVGRDGKIRSAEVVTTNQKIIRRPIQRLCLLELDE